MHFKDTQTQLSVSRSLPANTGCGQAVIIHYYIIGCDIILHSFKLGDPQIIEQIPRPIE